MTDCLSLRERYVAPGDGNPADAAWTQHLQQCAECRLIQQGLPLADRALAELAQLPVSVPDFAAIAEAAAGAARSQRRRHGLRRRAPYLYTGIAAAALAAGLVAAVLVHRSRQPLPELLVAGAELRATAEAKAARLGNGVRIRLDSGSLTLAASGRDSHALVLPLGRLSLEVPKLPSGSTLSVRTPDAEVRVHGTRFQVVRNDKETQVNVVEGVVEVRPEGIGRPVAFLYAGDSTTVGSAEAYREQLRRSTLAALDRGEFAAAEHQIGQLLGSSAEAAQRAEAKALLAWSLSARGKRVEAVARYRQALEILPQGQQPLWAENACAELAILVEQVIPKDAAAAWGECARRFPNGVHSRAAKARAR